MKKCVCLLLLVFLAACARPSKPVWTELPTTADLLQRLVATTGQVVSLDAAATVGLTVNGKFFSSQQFLLLEKPDRIRTDVLTGFGQLLLQLASDGEVLSVFDNTTVPGKFYRGAASSENLVRFTRIPLAGRDIVRLLLYDPPIISYQRSDVLVAGDNLRLQLSQPQLQQELTFDSQLRLIGCRYFTEGQLLLEVQYQKLGEDEHFPRTIRLEFATEKSTAVIKFSDIKKNVDIPAERFRLTKPVDIPVEPLPE